MVEKNPRRGQKKDHNDGDEPHYPVEPLDLF
jgi:hypothetical protein